MRIQCYLGIVGVAVLILPAVSHAQIEATIDAPPIKETPAIIQLDVWLVTLSSDADDDAIESARNPLEDRDAAAARVRELQEAKSASRSHHFMVTTLENEQLSVNVGTREPRVQATNITQFGKQQSIVYESVGTILQARTRVDDESRVLMEMQLESSYLDNSDVAMFQPKEGEPTTAFEVVNSLFHAHLACPSGGAVVASGVESRSESEKSTTLIYVAAKVLQ